MLPPLTNAGHKQVLSDCWNLFRDLSTQENKLRAFFLITKEETLKRKKLTYAFTGADVSMVRSILIKHIDIHSQSLPLRSSCLSFKGGVREGRVRCLYPLKGKKLPQNLVQAIWGLIIGWQESRALIRRVIQACEDQR